MRFAYDGDAMIAEYNNATTLLRRYVHGSNAEAEDPLVWYEGTSVASSSARHLHADPRGSIVLVAGSAGNTLAINTYDEYGIPDSASGDDIATKGRFRYTGQTWLPELDMYYYKARVYSPTLGRFLQTDPIGYEDQFNLYAYVANDPINRVDPDGRQSVPGTTAAICGGNSACWDQHNQARADIGAATIDFLFGDITTAARDPSFKNIAVAVVTTAFKPAKFLKVGSGTFRMGTAASTKLAARELERASVKALQNRGKGAVLGGPGAKTGRATDQADRLAKDYGGKPGEWQKVTSDTLAEGSDGTKVQIHAFRNSRTGELQEAKWHVVEPKKD